MSGADWWQIQQQLEQQEYEEWLAATKDSGTSKDSNGKTSTSLVEGAKESPLTGGANGRGPLTQTSSPAKNGEKQDLSWIAN